MSRFKRINVPLVLGSIIVCILFFISIYGNQLIPIDPFATNFGLPKVTLENLTLENPPYEPNEINIWGSDLIGRDIFSRIIYGANLTLKLGVIIALVRILIALPFAFLAGFGGKISSKIIDIFNITFSAIPILIISYIILGLHFVRDMEIDQAFLTYVIVLSMVGWGRMADILRERIKNIRAKEFIKGEVAIGKSKLKIAIQNVLPHLFATMIIYYFLEISRVLIIIAELGVLGVYIGINKVNPELIRRLRIDVMPSYYPEWGSMLASSRYAITAWKPWIAIYPALAIFISVLGFNLLGEGLKIELCKRSSKFIVFLKHMPYQLSPRSYIHEVRNIKIYKKNIFIKTAIILTLIIYLVIPAPTSKYQANPVMLFDHVEELSDPVYGARVLGTKEKTKATEYILNRLKENEIEPLFKNQYVQKLSTDADIKKVKKSQLYIKSENKNINFEYKTDYNLLSLYLDELSNNNYKGELTTKILTYERYKNDEYNKEEEYFLAFDGDKIRDYNEFMNDIIKNKSIIGIFSKTTEYRIKKSYPIQILGGMLDRKSSNTSSGLSNISVTENMLEQLEKHDGKQIVIKNEIKNIKTIDIVNIGGVIKGKDSTKPPMILACNYDYKENINSPKDIGLLYNGTSIASNLEIARVLKENEFIPERDIYILFFDCSLTTRTKGIDAFRKSNEYKNLSEDHFIMFLNYLGYKDSDTLFLDTSLLYSDNELHYNFVKIISKRGKELDIDVKPDKVAKPMDGITAMHSNGSSGVSIASVNDISRNEADILDQNIETIDKEKLVAQTQLIIDAITMYDYELEKELD